MDKSKVQKLLEARGMLFFGTHGELPDRPLETLLIVRGGQTEEILTAREIFASRVRPELIVMSACRRGSPTALPYQGTTCSASSVHSCRRVPGQWCRAYGTSRMSVRPS